MQSTRPQYARQQLWVLRLRIAVRYVVWDIRAHLPGGRYPRFVRLPAWCKAAADRGDSARAAKYARELLDLAARYSDDWNYGNALHDGHLVLGRVALAKGDHAEARSELLAAGRTPGSPQLNSFGPNMRLAKDMLDAGHADAVLEYFDLCRGFWHSHRNSLDLWRKDIAAGRMPNFGANLRY